MDADQVIVELIAKVDGFDGKVTQSAAAFDTSMKKIEKAAAKGEAATGKQTVGYKEFAAALKASGNDLRKTSLDVGVAAVGLGKFEKATTQAAYRSQLLGSNIGNVAAQLSSGSNPFLVLARQGPQVANAMRLVNLGTVALGSIMGGFLVTGVLAGAAALAKMVLTSHDAKSIIDDLVKSLKEKAEKTEQARLADEAFERTAVGAALSIDKITQALDEQNRSLEENIGLTKQKLDQDLAAVRGGIAQLEGKLAQARDDLRLAQQTAPLVAGGGADASREIANAKARVDELSASLAKLKSSASNGERALVAINFPLLERNAEAAVDPIKAINLQYDAMKHSAEQAALGNKKLADSLQQTLIGIEKNREAALKAERDRNKTQVATSQFILPASGPITSGFGSRAAPTKGASTFHPGIDIGGRIGDPVSAAAGGVVIHTGRLGGLGNVVIVDHGGGTITQYSHLSRIVAAKGQTVTQGQKIAEIGNTGITTGPHLDFRVKQGGKFVDPSKLAFPTDEAAAEIKAQRLAEQAANEAEAELRRRQAFANELAGLQDQEIDLRQALVTSAEEIAQLERDSIELSRQKYDDNLNSLVAQKKLLPEEATELRKINEERAKLRLELVQRREDERRFRIEEAAAQRKLAAQTGAIDVEQDLLQSRERLASTAKQRHELEQRLIALQFQEERLQLEAIIAEAERLKIKKNLTDAERLELEAALVRADLARQQLATSGERQANAQAGNDQANASPLQSFFGDIPNTADEINDAFEQIAAGGLATFTDALTNAIIQWDNFGQVGLAALASLTAGLVKMAVQQLLLHTVGQALGTTAVAATTAQAAAAGAAWAPAAALASLATLGANAGPAAAALAGTTALAQALAIPKLRDGGRVHGPGGPTSDRIPVMASADEFMIRAQAARSLGYDTLDFINRTGHLPSFFAGGGAIRRVSPANGNARSAGGKIGIDDDFRRELRSVVRDAASAMPDVSLYASLDPAEVLQRALSTPAGERALVASLGRNSGRVKATLDR